LLFKLKLKIGAATFGLNVTTTATCAGSGRIDRSSLGRVDERKRDRVDGSRKRKAVVKTVSFPSLVSKGSI